MDKVKLLINGPAHAGEGVGRHNGMAVFVPGTAPGDTVLVEIAHIKRNYSRSSLLEVIEQSPSRCRPECTSYGACGGCQLQYVDYAEQLRLKTTLARDNLAAWPVWTMLRSAKQLAWITHGTTETSPALRQCIVLAIQN
ncbi:TRAM domain-containing protein [Pelotomaculum propionicicum]|uniref:TRAM domain-containing protein n=1 Tax=Pelotomaculum propionicicum TaxID=258475 RepID=UPI003B773A7B